MYLCSVVVGTRPVNSLRNVAQAFSTALMAGGVATRGKSSPGMRCEISPTLSTMMLLLRDRVQRGFFCPHSTVLLILKMPVSKYTMSAPSSFYCPSHRTAFRWSSSGIERSPFRCFDVSRVVPTGKVVKAGSNSGRKAGLGRSGSMNRSSLAQRIPQHPPISLPDQPPSRRWNLKIE